jgi:hypothetical protein
MRGRTLRLASLVGTLGALLALLLSSGGAGGAPTGSPGAPHLPHDLLARAEARLALAGAPFAEEHVTCVPTGSGASARCVPVPASALTAAASGPPPEPAWALVNSSKAPTPRVGALLAYDAADGYVLLYGGDNASAVPPICERGCSAGFAETWIFENDSWRPLSGVNPPARTGASMVYDAADGYVLLVGGQAWCDRPNGTCPFVNDTWSFHRGVWSPVDTQGPPPRVDAAMAYDAADGYVLLYGGVLAGGRTANDSWSYAAGAWTQLSAAGPPADLFASSMTYDAADGYVLLLDTPQPGTSGLATPVTWAFSRGAWQLLATNGAPPDLYGAWLAYDPAAGFTVLMGMEIGGSPSTSYNVTWGYVGTNWFPVPTPDPSLRLGLSSLAYDAASGELVGFGGEQWANGSLPPRVLNDTWVFSAPPLGFSMNVAVSPPGVCPQSSPGCPAGGNTTRVDLSVETVYVPATALPPGADPVVADPTFTFVPFGEVALPGNLSVVQPSVVCSDPEGFTGTCNLSTDLVTEPNRALGLAWKWSSTPGRDQMLVRAKWSASFWVTVLAPPFGAVPVDACVTPDCVGDGSGPVVGNYTALSFSPYGNSSRATVSFGPGLVFVEAPAPPPPVTVPPPPAPPIPPPPAARGVVPPPAAGAGSGSGAPPSVPPAVALSPVAAGLLAAGFTRLPIRRKVVMAVGALSGPSTGAGNGRGPGGGGRARADRRDEKKRSRFE